MPRKATFSEKQLAEFRANLEQMRKEIQQSIQARLASKRDLEIKDIGDSFDSASEGREQEFGYLMNTRDREKMMKIADALRRLDAGEYGICEECGEPIGVKRLRAMPFATLCLRCQEEEEEMTALQRERQLEEDEQQYFELAESELGEGGMDDDFEE